MDTLPIELVTIIACDSFKLFTTLLLVPTIGLRLCAEYPQLIAREKFIRIGVLNEYDGGIYSYLGNMIHSFNDQPAIIYNNGNKYWFWYGKKHRGGDQPAFVDSIGYKSWFWHGERHRENDLPAIEWETGKKEWYRHGLRYRK